MGSVSTDSTDPKVEEMVAIMDGGPNFIKRLSALQAERKALEKAREEVHSSIKLKGTIDDAERMRRDAEKVLEDATAKAAEIVKEAETKADRICWNAQENINKADQHVTKLKASTATEISERVKIAEAKRSEAQAMRDEAAALHAEAKAKENELTRRLVEAEENKKAAQALQAEFEGKLRQLAEVLAKVR